VKRVVAWFFVEFGDRAMVGWERSVGECFCRGWERLLTLELHQAPRCGFKLQSQLSLRDFL
jgi:hypothetical protein